MQKFSLLLFVLLLSCVSKKETNPLRVINKADSVLVAIMADSLLQNKAKQASASLQNTQSQHGWTMANQSNTPKTIYVICRTLIDHDLRFVVFDGQQPKPQEQKRLYWGMPQQQRELEGYVPVKSVFVDAHSEVGLVVGLGVNKRKPVKLIFEVSTADVLQEIAIRKMVDAISSAFILLNIFFSWRFLRHNQPSKAAQGILRHYLLYNLFLFLFYFVRYYSTYLIGFDLPIALNYSVEISAFCAVYCYYCFGLRFIDTQNQAHTFANHQKAAAWLIGIYLVLFFVPALSFSAALSTYRILVLLGLLVSLYYESYLRRTQLPARLLLWLSFPLMLIAFYNMLYFNLTALHFNFQYGPEATKLLVAAESFVLFGGFILRRESA